MENKVNNIQMMRIRKSFDFLNGIIVVANGSKRDLCPAWKDLTYVCLRSFSNHHIDVDVTGDSGDICWRLIGFYGSPYVQDKREVWDLLRMLVQVQSSP